jgi:penicillin amidase
MKFVKAILSILVTAFLISALETKFGDIPAIGVFLNPSTGFWQNAESKNIIPTEKLKLTGLQDEVTRTASPIFSPKTTMTFTTPKAM